MCESLLSLKNYLLLHDITQKQKKQIHGYHAYRNRRKEKVIKQLQHFQINILSKGQLNHSCNFVIIVARL